MKTALQTTILTAITLSLPISTLAQQTETKVTARNVIGSENVKRNSSGTLAIQNGEFHFTTTNSDAKVVIASIDDIVVGSEVTQAGGKAGTVAKTAAMAAPYDSGAVLSVMLRTTTDIVTIAYRDSGGGLHYAILALPKGQGDPQRSALIAAGARVNNPIENAESKERTVAPGAAGSHGQKLTASAIQIEPVGADDVRIPLEFRAAIYEFLVERVRASGVFRQVFRSGDRAAESVSNLVTLHVDVEKFKEGSEMKRELTTVLGSTKLTVDASVTTKDGRSVLDDNIQGKVLFHGENLGVTDDVAKRIAKLLKNSFTTT